MSTLHPNQQEAQKLMGRVNDIVPVSGGSSLALDKLKDQLQEILDGKCGNLLEEEENLEAISIELRSIWLAKSHQVSGGYLKSPPHDQVKMLPSGQKIQFDYERSARPRSLERRCQKFVNVPDDWRSAHMVFSSGMGALATIIQLCCARLDGPSPARPVSLGMFGGYFETWRLLDFLQDATFDVRHLLSNEEITSGIQSGECDALLIEPVAYDWQMTVFDRDAFLKTWAETSGKHPRVLIIDTSITGHRFSVEGFLAEFTVAPPQLVIGIRSGLKLDQEGLELSNVGIADFFIPRTGMVTDLLDLVTRLGAARSVMGAGLSFYQMAILEAPWFLNRRQFEEFGNSIFQNNENLARSINLTGGVFSKISHPVLEKDADLSWAVSPFTVFHLAEDSVGNHGFLVAVLMYEAKRRRLQFTAGSSFGFRGHRFEVIKPAVQLRPNPEQTGLLKVAMGARQGASFEGVLELIGEVAAFADFAALREAYGDVKAYVKDKSGVFVARPPRG